MHAWRRWRETHWLWHWHSVFFALRRCFCAHFMGMIHVIKVFFSLSVCSEFEDHPNQLFVGSMNFGMLEEWPRVVWWLAFFGNVHLLEMVRFSFNYVKIDFESNSFRRWINWVESMNFNEHAPNVGYFWASLWPLWPIWIGTFAKCIAINLIVSGP